MLDRCVLFEFPMDKARKEMIGKCQQASSISASKRLTMPRVVRFDAIERSIYSFRKKLIHPVQYTFLIDTNSIKRVKLILESTFKKRSSLRQAYFTTKPYNRYNFACIYILECKKCKSCDVFGGGALRRLWGHPSRDGPVI